MTPLTTSRNKRESGQKTFVITRSRGFADAANRAVGRIGAGVRVGAAAPSILALVRADADRNINAKLNLFDVLLTVLTEVEVRTEGPVVLDKAAINNLLVLETGANLGARIDDVDKEYVILDNLILNILRDGVRRVVAVDLCAVAKGNVTSVENAGKDVVERKQRNSP